MNAFVCTGHLARCFVKIADSACFFALLKIEGQRDRAIDLQSR